MFKVVLFWSQLFQVRKVFKRQNQNIDRQRYSKHGNHNITSVGRIIVTHADTMSFINQLNIFELIKEFRDKN